ncbi:MAG: helix-turn-helix transcriptional regulator [Oscillospiraceae bacterium]|nr:helix-turn-helix transcriptional regulator [Oscillospiraceae bacterium]
MDSIGSRIKAARKRRGMSQKALAKRICKCASAVSGYENDFQIPPLDVLVTIAKVLDVSLGYLACLQPHETYTVDKLRPKQKEIVDLLFTEFSDPTNTSGLLSPQQIEIIQKLVLLFSQKKQP